MFLPLHLLKKKPKNLCWKLPTVPRSFLPLKKWEVSRGLAASPEVFWKSCPYGFLSIPYDLHSIKALSHSALQRAGWTLGGDTGKTTQLKWPKGYSMWYNAVLSNANWGRRRMREGIDFFGGPCRRHCQKIGCSWYLHLWCFFLAATAKQPLLLTIAMSKSMEREVQLLFNFST